MEQSGKDFRRKKVLYKKPNGNLKVIKVEHIPTKQILAVKEVLVSEYLEAQG